MNSFATHADVVVHASKAAHIGGRRRFSLVLVLALALALLYAVVPLATPLPVASAASVHAVLVGNLQTELEAPADWDPANNTTLMKDPNADGIYTFTGFVPAGDWEYKVALNSNWTESYPANNARLSIPTGGLTVTFRYNAATHAVEDSVNNPGLVAVVASSFQSELGAAGDWNPADNTTRMFDPDGDGLYAFTTNIPAGTWEYKVALNGAWNESYPGMNRVLTVPAGGSKVTFLYYSKSHVVKDSINDQDVVTAVVASDVQQELGASSDWNPADMTTQMTDSDGDGVYVYQADLPKGSWQYKIALHSAWNESYPASNVVLNIPADGTTVAFTYDAKTHAVKDSINNPPVASHDNNIWWNELRHDSRQTLYRSPFGSVPTGQPVTLRIQTARGDLTGAQIRVWDQIQAREEIYPMQSAGTDPDGRFDYWQAVIPGRTEPTILWYRFVLVDGTRRAYYGDDGSRDGGLGAVTDYPTDYDYQITVYQAGFTTPDWMKDAVVYQIFPDRFNNGDPTNDPQPTDPDVHGWPVVFKQWNDLPEQPPRGRDFFGGDLAGVINKLDYLQSLGIKAIYFNPIFQAASNHLYDTTDYKAIDPYFGDLAAFQSLAAEAGKRGIRLILDGVFNHTGSDSLYFDKYSRYSTLGAYESQSSPYFDWYTFRLWPNDYESWWNFDTLPKLRAENPAVQNFIFGAPDSVARYWLNQGSNGWRLDVANEVAHPFWQKFRPAVKATRPDAVIIGELWEDASPWLLGNEFDSTMNYRFRNAVLGFFADGTLNAEAFNNVLEAIREDYPAEAFYAAMNLVDSHDTARILRRLNEDKALLKLVAIFQMTYPGAPTIYYGDEVGLTGGPDPDSRRPYPWGGEDLDLLAHYKNLIALRNAKPVLRTGSITPLLADSAKGYYVFGRKDTQNAAVVIINNGTVAGTVTVKVAGYLPEGTILVDQLNGGAAYTVASGQVAVTIPAKWGSVLITQPGQDLSAPAAPAGLVAAAGKGQVNLAWTANSETDLAGYNVYRSTVHGGYYNQLNAMPVAGAAYLDTTVQNSVTYYYVVKAVDRAGNESQPSEAVAATPTVPIGWAGNLWPQSITYTINALSPTETIYAQVWADGLTNFPGQGAGMLAQVGYGPAGSDPALWETWTDMKFNMDKWNNDEYMGSLLPEQTGQFVYQARFSSDGGKAWLYTDTQGTLTVNPSGDATAPAPPQGLMAATTLGQITLLWQANTEDDLFRYDIYRSTTSGLSYVKVASVDKKSVSYTDGGLDKDTAYYYVVRAVDTSFNASALSQELAAMPRPRKVEVAFQVAAPWYTPPGDTIYLAGNFPAPYYWNPGNRPMSRVDETHWSITLVMDEGTKLEYKYTRGNWGKVEKNPDGSEMSNRQALIVYGTTGKMTISDTVARWADLRLAVVSPADNLVTNDSVVQVTGNVLPGEALSVNGRAVQPVADGDFRVEVRLVPGLNTIAVAAGTGGNAVTVTRKVTYQTRVELTVTPAGANIEIFDKKLKLDIPAGAVKSYTRLVLEVLDENGPVHPRNLKRLSKSYLVAADVKKFRVPVIISISFDAAALNGLAFEDLGIFTAKRDNGKEIWHPFEGVDDDTRDSEGGGVDLADGTVTVRTEHYGKLAVMARLEEPENKD